VSWCARRRLWEGLDPAQEREQHRLRRQGDPQRCGGRRGFRLQHQHFDHPAANQQLAQTGAQKARLTPDDVPLVIGCGPVGLAVIASPKISGVHPIIAADFSSKRRSLAVEMGADIVVDPGERSPYMSWHQAATPAGYDGSRYAQLFGFSPKLAPAVIFECVGVPGVIQQVIDGARPALAS